MTAALACCNSVETGFYSRRMSDPASDSYTMWIVGAVGTGILGLIAFLSRNTFTTILKNIEGVSAKLDVMSTQMADQRADHRVLQERLNALDARVRALEGRE